MIDITNNNYESCLPLLGEQVYIKGYCRGTQTPSGELVVVAASNHCDTWVGLRCSLSESIPGISKIK